MEFKIKSQKLSIQSSDTKAFLDVYAAQPEEQGLYPLVLVGMEIFGVNQHIRSICDEIAKLGCIAVAPDYYSRIARGAELAYSQQDREVGLKYMHQLNRPDVLSFTATSIHFFKKQNNCSGKVGFIGFSVGGHIAYLAATTLPIELTVCFYPGWLTNSDILLSRPEPTILLTAGMKIKDGKLIFIKGDLDQLVTDDQIRELDETLKTHKLRHEMIIYPRVVHGFFCDERPSTFNQNARDDSWAKIKSAISEELGITNIEYQPN